MTIIATRSQIEDRILQLSFREQVGLMEWLAITIRHNSSFLDMPANDSARDDVFAAMAADPEIQSELAVINAEFAVADMDGLENR